MKKIISITLLTLAVFLISCGTPMERPDTIAIDPTLETMTPSGSEPTQPGSTPDATFDSTAQAVQRAMLTINDIPETNVEMLIVAEENKRFETEFFVLNIPQGVVYSDKTVETFELLMYKIQDFTGLDFITEKNSRKINIDIEKGRIRYGFTWGENNIDLCESFLVIGDPGSVEVFVHEMAHILHARHFPHTIGDNRLPVISEGFASLVGQLVTLDNVIHIDDFNTNPSRLFWQGTVNDTLFRGRILQNAGENLDKMLAPNEHAAVDLYITQDYIGICCCYHPIHFVGYVFLRYIYDNFGWDGVIKFMEASNTRTRPISVVDIMDELFEYSQPYSVTYADGTVESGVHSMSFASHFRSWYEDNRTRLFKIELEPEYTERNGIHYEFGNPIQISGRYNMFPVVVLSNDMHEDDREHFLQGYDDIRSHLENSDLLMNYSDTPALTFRLRDEPVLIDFREGHKLFERNNIFNLQMNLQIQSPQPINVYAYDENHNLLFFEENTKHVYRFGNEYISTIFCPEYALDGVYGVAYLILENQSDVYTDVILQYQQHTSFSVFR